MKKSLHAVSLSESVNGNARLFQNCILVVKTNSEDQLHLYSDEYLKEKYPCVL